MKILYTISDASCESKTISKQKVCLKKSVKEKISCKIIFRSSLLFLPLQLGTLFFLPFSPVECFKFW